MSDSHSADYARGLVKDVSNLNIDDLVRISSFSPDCIHSICEHIHLEYKTWYAFKKLASDCSRSNIALHGFAMFFARAATECLADAVYLEKYLIQRGGVSQPTDIPAPKARKRTRTEPRHPEDEANMAGQVRWSDDPVEPLGPLQECLKMEREILEDTNRLCEVAANARDYALQETVARRFLEKETKHVKNMGDMLQEVARVAKVPGHGLYHLDKELRVKLGKTPWSSVNKPHSVDHLLEHIASEMASASSI